MLEHERLDTMGSATEMASAEQGPFLLFNLQYARSPCPRVDGLEMHFRSFDGVHSGSRAWDHTFGVPVIMLELLAPISLSDLVCVLLVRRWERGRALYVLDAVLPSVSGTLPIA